MRNLRNTGVFAIGLSVLLLLSFKLKEQAYQVDARQSNIHWLGTKTTGTHEGDVPVKSGAIKVNNGVPVSGMFILSVDAITCTDIKEPEDNKSLVDHLKDEDFFNTAKYPTATLTIKKFEKIAGALAGMPNYTATADLTIKDIKKEIRFPAWVEVTPAAINANAKITIDRTKWGITYKSKTIFNTLGDKFIHDDIDFTVKLVLKK